MLRISQGELLERWALTYAEDGYKVQARDGDTPSAESAGAALTASRGEQRVLVHVISSPEELDAPQTRAALQASSHERDSHTSLHVVVAAECVGGFKDKLDQWGVHPDQVHVT